MPQLIIEHLSVLYQHDTVSTQAVDRVDLTVEAGEIVALVGESGCGKTSLGLALARLLPEPPAVISGRVLLDGVDVLQLSEDRLREVRGGKIAYVFQDPATSLNPVLTVGEQLLEAIVFHTEARGPAAASKAVEWLQRVGIRQAAERMDAYPHELSGGMQQRACLAMALAGEPAVLVADEPTTALDVTVQVQILRLLRDLQRTLRLSVLLISHDLLVVERLAHRVGVMRAGKLVELGATPQVLTHPHHPYTQELVRYRSLLALRPPPHAP